MITGTFMLSGVGTLLKRIKGTSTFQGLHPRVSMVHAHYISLLIYNEIPRCTGVHIICDHAYGYNNYTSTIIQMKTIYFSLMSCSGFYSKRLNLEPRTKKELNKREPYNSQLFTVRRHVNHDERQDTVLDHPDAHRSNITVKSVDTHTKRLIPVNDHRDHRAPIHSRMNLRIIIHEARLLM